MPVSSESWTLPKLPLNTPAVTKDVYKFTANEQQVAKKKYAALLASNLEDADLLGTADTLNALSQYSSSSHQDPAAQPLAAVGMTSMFE